MKELLDNLHKIPDFPKPGICFYDVTSWMSNPDCMETLQDLSWKTVPSNIDCIVAIDARGFIVGTQLAHALRRPLYLARKKGKLPVPVDEQSYSLEYGQDTLCLEKGVIKEGDNVLIVDDLLATGGTIGAIADIVKLYKPASITAFVWIELQCEGLKGRKFLESRGVSVKSLLTLH